jgi:hypothetical protein
VRRQSEAATALWFSLRDGDRESKAVSPLLSATALQILSPAKAGFDFNWGRAAI